MPGLILCHLLPDESSLWLMTQVLSWVSKGYRAAVSEVRADEKWRAFFMSRAQDFLRRIPDLETHCDYRAIMRGMRVHQSYKEVQLAAIEALRKLIQFEGRKTMISKNVLMLEMMHRGAFDTLMSTMHAFENDNEDMRVVLWCMLIVQLLVGADELVVTQKKNVRTPEDRHRVIELARASGVFETITRVLLTQRPGMGIVIRGLRIMNTCAAHPGTAAELASLVLQRAGGATVTSHRNSFE